MQGGINVDKEESEDASVEDIVTHHHNTESTVFTDGALEHQISGSESIDIICQVFLERISSIEPNDVDTSLDILKQFRIDYGSQSESILFKILERHFSNCGSPTQSVSMKEESTLSLLFETQLREVESLRKVVNRSCFLHFFLVINYKEEYPRLYQKSFFLTYQNLFVAITKLYKIYKKNQVPIGHNQKICDLLWLYLELITNMDEEHKALLVSLPQTTRFFFLL